MHVDTGHNFPEVIEFRDRRVAELGERLIVASVQDSIDAGRVVDADGPARLAQPAADRRRCSTRSTSTASTPRSAARAATRSARARRSASSASATTSAAGTRARSAPSSGTSTTAAIRKGEHVRVFPISNWTELDVWQYIAREGLELPSIYFAHEREVFERDGMLYADVRLVERRPTRSRSPTSVRYRTVGDMTLHRRACARTRATIEDVVAEIAATRITERGETRADDRVDGGRDGGPQARGLLLVEAAGTAARGRAGAAAPRHLRLRRRRQVDPDRPAAATTRSRSSTTRWSTSTRRAARRGDGDVDLALLTDGLRAEREQGITIDVAYRSFVTDRAPLHPRRLPRPRAVHAQHGHRRLDRRRRASCSSTRARACIEQTRRHLSIAALLRVPHVVVAVNKMDLVDWDEERFTEIADELRSLADGLGLPDLVCVPISALEGDNVVEPVGDIAPWYAGPSLVTRLEDLPIDGADAAGPLRFPCSGSSGPRASTATTAATPGASPAAPSASATRSSCSRPARRPS